MKFKQIFISVVLIIITMFTLNGCNSEKYVVNYESYKNLKGAEIEKLIAETKDLLIIDVRTPNEYKEGHIRNAINIPVDTIDKNISNIEQYKNKPVLVYCRSGSRSTIAAKRLASNGFTDVYNAVDGVSEYNYRFME